MFRKFVEFGRAAQASAILNQMSRVGGSINRFWVMQAFGTKQNTVAFGA